MATKKTNKKADRKGGLLMSDGMKEKYAELFIDALDQMEASEYTMPWVSARMGQPCNLYRKGKPYKGVNAFLLTLLCGLKGWEVPYFLTKTDLKNEDGSRKYKGLTANRTLKVGEDGMPVFSDKGEPIFDYEHRFPVFFFKPQYKDADGKRITEQEYDELTAEEQAECRTYWIQQSYLVYNLGQTDFKERYPDEWADMTREPEHEYKAGQRDEVLERMIMQGEWRCPIEFGGSEAYYSPSKDIVRLPERSKFLGDERFYQAALHEMAHSTGPELKREQKNVFGTEGYAMEEFIAELTSACVCSMLGIGKLLDEQHIAYVQNWRKALREDRDFIPQVIDHVQRASNYILRKYDEVNRAMHPLALPMAA